MSLNSAKLDSLKDKHNAQEVQRIEQKMEDTTVPQPPVEKPVETQLPTE